MKLIAHVEDGKHVDLSRYLRVEEVASKSELKALREAEVQFRELKDWEQAELTLPAENRRIQDLLEKLALNPKMAAQLGSVAQLRQTIDNERQALKAAQRLQTRQINPTLVPVLAKVGKQVAEAARGELELDRKRHTDAGLQFDEKRDTPRVVTHLFRVANTLIRASSSPTPHLVSIKGMLADLGLHVEL